MRAFLDFAIALTRAWAAVYTRGLPSDARTDRREEIDCDLWHQQRLADLEREPVTGTAVQILVRLLLGFPDDIFWRLETGAFARSGRNTMLTKESLPMRGVVVAGIAMSLFLTSMGSASTVAGLLEADDGWAAGGAISAVSGIAVTVGLLVSRRSPLTGISLVAAGSIAIAITWSWIPGFTIPTGTALVAIAVVRALGGGWPRRADGRPPTGAPAA